MKRIAVGLALIAAGFIGGLLAQQPQFRAPGGPEALVLVVSSVACHLLQA